MLTRILQSIQHTSMTKPYDVKLQDYKVFVLSNIDNPYLYVFSHSDEKLRSLMACDYQRIDQVKIGHFSCFDKRQNILL